MYEREGVFIFSDWIFSLTDCLEFYISAFEKLCMALHHKIPSSAALNHDT